MSTETLKRIQGTRNSDLIITVKFKHIDEENYITLMLGHLLYISESLLTPFSVQ